MSKVTDLLKALNKSFAIPELEAALSASNLEDAISDELVTKVTDTISGNWLTLDAAKNNADLKEHYKNVLKPVHIKSFSEKKEQELHDLFADMDDVSEVLKGKEMLNDKLAVLKDLIKEGKKGGASTEEIEKYKKTANDLKKQITEFESLKNKEIEGVRKESDDKINGFKQTLIRAKYEQIAGSKEWADAYKIDAAKKALLDSTFNSLSERAFIDLDDKGEIVLKNKENPDLELFEGSHKVTFNSLVESQIEPFIKKSGGSPPAQPASNGKPTTTDLGGMNWQARQIAAKRAEMQH